MLGTVPPKVSGVNFVVETLNVWSLPVGLYSVMVNEVGWPTATFPKLAETGSSHVVASAATERFSRPAPWAVGPMSCVPVNESLITKSARLTSADLTCAGDHDGLRPRSTFGEPAMFRVDVDAHRSDIGLDEYVRRRRALAAKASQNVLVVRRDEFLERLDRRRGGFSGCSQRCPVVLANHNCWQVVAAQPVFCHGDRITRDIVNHKHTHSADRDRVAHLCAERASPAVDYRQLA